MEKTVIYITIRNYSGGYYTSDRSYNGSDIVFNHICNAIDVYKGKYNASNIYIPYKKLDDFKLMCVAHNVKLTVIES